MIEQKWRKFSSIEEMNDKIISNWNKLIDKEDVVYHLGDVCIGGKIDFTKKILPKLNGSITFIRGNHDSKSLTNIISLIIDYKGKLIELIHNPEKATKSTKYILHGHQHKSGKQHFLNKDKDIKYFNTNLEYNHMKPVLLKEILGRLDKK